ncbi:hypothetical protein [Thermostaphylospora chromogena]|uniref:DUF732 domain-containing protein n=1 Tax=Thermostaphylospora chromogena TaxID=35622 RepID=A0A1H1GEV0_9ACTN|nr:hypothetical protein [Thermostaphylospora chromogena]SDR11764.1 hypothetical protein SAMN04489764_3550 [Thermostaphylospora chromogena]
MRTPTKAALPALCLTLLATAACAPDAPAAQPAGAPRGTPFIGARPDDDPCTRVLSALGFADLLLLPAGQEEHQNFDDAVRGRLAYVQGVVLQYGSRLPSEVHDEGATLRRTAKALAPAVTPHEEQIRLLREYRRAERAVRDACP